MPPRRKTTKTHPKILKIRLCKYSFPNKGQEDLSPPVELDPKDFPNLDTDHGWKTLESHLCRNFNISPLTHVPTIHDPDDCNDPITSVSLGERKFDWKQIYFVHFHPLEIEPNQIGDDTSIPAYLNEEPASSNFPIPLQDPKKQFRTLTQMDPWDREGSEDPSPDDDEPLPSAPAQPQAPANRTCPSCGFFQSSDSRDQEIHYDDCELQMASTTRTADSRSNPPFQRVEPEGEGPEEDEGHDPGAEDVEADGTANGEVEEGNANHDQEAENVETQWILNDDGSLRHRGTLADFYEELD